VVITILQVVLILLFVGIGNSFNLGQIFYFSLIIIACLMIYHQFLMKKQQNEQYFKAFIHNNYIGMTAFAGIFFSVAI
jgi:4-hydroxybenzoate polyprenyltransferase